MYQIERDHRFYDGYAADRRLRQRLQGGAPVIELPPCRNPKAAAHAAAFFAPGPVAQAPDQLTKACCASGYREMCLLSNFSPQKHQSCSSRCGFFVPGASAPVAQAPINWLSLLRQLHNQGVIGPV
ncbi:hypothetical protein EMIT048CA2_90119 [Pseudomonas chlororaphis]